MRTCTCGHDQSVHVFDGGDSICAMPECPCCKFLACAIIADPYGRTYEAPNIAAFVRSNGGLFDLYDTIQKKCPSYTVQGRRTAYYTNADRGLYAVQEERVESWKGWTLVTRTQTV